MVLLAGMRGLDPHESQGNLLAEARKCVLSVQVQGQGTTMRRGRQTPHTSQLLPVPSLLDGLPSSAAPAQPGQDQTQCQAAVPFKTVTSLMIIIIS